MPSSYAWGGDILMILDCCYALQACRDKDARTVEILAASGLLEMTPPAGNWSFTSRLIRVISDQLAKKGEATVEEIYTALLRLTGKDMLSTTPARILLKGDGESIYLSPQKGRGPGTQETTKPLTLLSLTISLSSAFDDTSMRRFQKWLRTHIPSNISAIKVDEVFLRTERIQAWLQDPQKKSLTATVAHDITARGHLDTIVLQPSLFEAHASLGSGRAVDETGAKEALDKLRVWNEHVYESIQRNVLLNPSFSSTEALERLREDAEAQQLGLSEAATLRLLSSRLEQDFDYTSLSSLPKDEIFEIRELGRLSVGKTHEGLVLIENRPYGNGVEPKELVVKRVRKLSRLLAEVSNPMFHIARYVGYIDRPLTKQLSLVFASGLTTSAATDKPFMTLKEAYGEEKFVPLETRLNLALALAKALSNIHVVGWLHKSLRSENVIFVATRDTEAKFDLGRPLLFGFDLSRAHTDSSAGDREFRQAALIYTHPQRWGVPRSTFGTLHDIYALGVVLLEIGCWRAAATFDLARNGFAGAKDESTVRLRLLEVAQTYLQHMAGKMYAHVVTTCLTGQFEDDDEMVETEAGRGHDPSRLHSAFSERVLRPLAKAVASF